MRGYTPQPPPFDIKDLPRATHQELRRIAGVISALSYINISGKYDISAGATVTISPEDVATAGLALFVVDGPADPGCVLAKVNRTGAGNGLFRLSQDYGATSTASATWGLGATIEPTDGTQVRAWVSSASAGAGLSVKLITGATRALRIYSLRV